MKNITEQDANDLIARAAEGRWSEQQAADWYAAQPWPVGCNFLPSCASNQLEMWQAESFNPAIIRRELGWLADIGMNTVRVFLHDLLWRQDSNGFLARMDRFLAIAHALEIRPMFVLFDSCWHPFPRLGQQDEPEPGVHNSRWLQSPGLWTLKHKNPSAAFDRLRPYVTGVIRHFRDDPRVLAWDLWNEPDNSNTISRAPRDFPTAQAKGEAVFPLLAKTFQWAREAGAAQPLTSGIWCGSWETDDDLAAHAPLGRLQVCASDVVSFHCYAPLAATHEKVKRLQRFGRPLLCTEYMARPTGSTFEAILPYFQQEGIAAFNWGAVEGRSQTHYPWDSWQMPYASEPQPWFHDIFRTDGTPYLEEETKLIKKLTGVTRQGGLSERPPLCVV
ncbi:1,4-beta-xylanase [Opitutaceae bacterium TAV4]|nr:1,4-beta-xylanase [Opitutaceae bacterium TAV4]RRJ99620.1 1,4-beta-xylanase [Opitutaceae bacterium TAV3]